MGKNGGKPQDTILTLEEALKRFARKRTESIAESKKTTELDPSMLRASEGAQESQGANVHYADFSAATKREQDVEADVGVGVEAPPGPEVSEAPPAPVAEAASSSDSERAQDIVPVIDGIPRTLDDLEQLAAADKAFREDFRDNSDEPEFLEEEIADSLLASEAMGRNTYRRDIAFGVMGAALLVWVAVLVTRVPIVNNGPTTFAKAVATPALRASSLKSAQELISTWVIIPDSDSELASSGSVQPDELEAAIKDTLKTRAFPDIGVSVSHRGEAYLAGDVYSLHEVRRIRQIARGVSGVRRVHFLHPDVLPVVGPAYFGVTTAWAPEVWGAKVQAVVIGSPADKAGLQPGDIISEFDGKTIPDGKSLDDLIAQYSPGQRVEFRVWHDAQPVYLVARLTEMTTMASR